MCGIAGLIHRGKSSNVGEELQNMLQALKHRGPDSTGYALYANNDGQNFILRFKVGENVGEGSTSVNEDESVYDERKKIVDKKLADLGAPIIKEEKLTPYSYRYEIQYGKDLMWFSKAIESIENVEILSIGTELLLGNIVNTNAQWISEQLSQLGLNHFRQSTVGDNCDRIIKVIQEISKRSNLLITTGGLGPTPDDLTTEAIAKSFNMSLYERPYLWEEIRQKISESKLQENSSSLRKQCFFPKNEKLFMED